MDYSSAMLRPALRIDERCEESRLKNVGSSHFWLEIRLKAERMRGGVPGRSIGKCYVWTHLER